MAESRWARGSNQYIARAQSQAASGTGKPDDEITLADTPTSEREAATGIHWDSSALDFELLTKMSVDRTRVRLRG
jgi:hypothetical protein